ncbi:hypothetical protein DFJ74DRAFT_256558 [Hyaloraphidium curvatum]|nr:hypothetical protein DFJ74DRAFT_256558 [Hyaloraphidium curvatum]
MGPHRRPQDGNPLDEGRRRAGRGNDAIHVTKPVAGGLISSRYLVCGTNYGYLTPERYCLSAVSVNSVHDAAVAAAEKKAGSSLKGLVKAELHHSGSVLDKVEGGWRFSYMIHVTLGGWLPGSLVEATMTDQIIGFVSLWLEFTTKEFGPKA